MALERIKGDRAGRYRDTVSGAILPRRQAENLIRPTQQRARDISYRERNRQRAEAVSFIPKATLDKNKAYWRARYRDQLAGHMMEAGWPEDMTTVDRAAAIVASPGGEFNRLWNQAKAEGFEGGAGSAWDKLSYKAGARGGSENERERSKYLAVIAWYQRNDEAGKERWIHDAEWDASGHFVRPWLAAS